MEDEYKDGIIPWYWNIEHFSRYIKEQEAERRGPSFPRKKRLRHSAAEMALPPEIASALHRRGSHPSEWEPIRDRESLRGLRAGERLLLYRRTRKGWEPVSGELTHGARPGESLIALRRRRIQLQPPRLEDGFTFAEGLRWSPHLGPQRERGQFSYHCIFSSLNIDWPMARPLRVATGRWRGMRHRQSG
jgi:hypothetical protein